MLNKVICKWTNKWKLKNKMNKKYAIYDNNINLK